MVDMIKLGPITRANCGEQLVQIREVAGKLTITKLAKILGVSRSSVQRIEEGQTLPSDEFLNRLEALQVLGASRFRKLSEKEKTNYTDFFEKLTMKSEFDLGQIENIALSSIGVVHGLTAVGYASLVSMPIAFSSLSLLVSIPVMTALRGVLDANKLNCEEVNGRWEIVLKPKKENENDKRKSK